MRSLLTFMLLAAAMLPALSQAHIINICDRTPQVRDEILRTLQVSGLQADNCAAVDSDWLTELSFPNLTTLQAGDFDGLTSLQTLDLQENPGLTALPDGVFGGLTSLRALHLTKTQLTTLPDGVFDGLTSLQYLGLNEN